MNSYTFKKAARQPLTAEDLRFIALASFIGKNFRYENQTIHVDAGFGISNLSLSGDDINTEIYDSRRQATIENFDKPVVETGDIVVALVDVTSDEGKIKQYYDDYKVLRAVTNLGGETSRQMDVFIGISNSSESDFHTPFDGILHLAFSSSRVENLISNFS